jgi:hypothetical protein
MCVPVSVQAYVKPLQPRPLGVTLPSVCPTAWWPLLRWHGCQLECQGNVAGQERGQARALQQGVTGWRTWDVASLHRVSAEAQARAALLASGLPPGHQATRDERDHHGLRHPDTRISARKSAYAPRWQERSRAAGPSPWAWASGQCRLAPGRERATATPSRVTICQNWTPSTPFPITSGSNAAGI